MKFKVDVLVNIHVAYSSYKLTHVSKYLHCFKLFDIGKLIIHLVLHEFLCAMNSILKNQVEWPKDNAFIEVMDGFEDLCGMLSIHGAIDATHIHM